MNATQIERLLEGVSAGVPPHRRRRLDGYANTARRCDERIAALRSTLADAIHAAGDDAGTAAADRVLDLMVELDGLERIQLRVDAGLRASVGALADDVVPTPVGEGPA